MRAARIRKASLWVVALCVAVPAAYVLSVGPALLIHSKMGADYFGGAIAEFYDPLFSYLDNNRGAVTARAIGFYVDVWADLAGLHHDK
jgi:hypothetical protein